MSLKVLTENTTKSMHYNLEWNGEYSFEVKDSWGNTFIVNLGTQTCTCRSWMLRGIPCCHAIAALHFRKLEPINYVAHWYNKDTYLKVYSHYIQPVTNMEMWPQLTNLLYYHLLSKYYQKSLESEGEMSRMKVKQKNCPREV